MHICTWLNSIPDSAMGFAHNNYLFSLICAGLFGSSASRVVINVLTG